MPERPESVNSAELSAVVDGVRESFARTFAEGLAELAGALKPGQNVRDLASSTVSIFTVTAPTTSTSIIGADETRTKLTLIAGDDDVRLYSTPGTSAPNGILLPANTPVDIDTRAALYVSSASGVTNVGVIAQQAVFYA